MSKVATVASVSRSNAWVALPSQCGHVIALSSLHHPPLLRKSISQLDPHLLLIVSIPDVTYAGRLVHVPLVRDQWAGVNRREGDDWSLYGHMLPAPVSV